MYIIILIHIKNLQSNLNVFMMFVERKGIADILISTLHLIWLEAQQYFSCVTFLLKIQMIFFNQIF